MVDIYLIYLVPYLQILLLCLDFLCLYIFRIQLRDPRREKDVVQIDTNIHNTKEIDTW